MSTSSHAVANACNVLLFIHHVFFIQMRYFKKRVLQSCNHILKLLAFNIKEGFIFRDLLCAFINKYECNFIDNELDTLRARIYWVQRHEPQSGRELDLPLRR